ncbi:uncharacterized protein EDB91DRAFT_1133953, partial [Suillus paluster]|uniref:uncharacterized protein n=1 Tax=Suillus paluster TaxID=48578 RepID=UPI001B86A4EA
LVHGLCPIHQSFNSTIANDHSGDELVFYGPFTRLLYTLFSLEGPYEISSIDLTVVFVSLSRFLRSPTSFSNPSVDCGRDEYLRRSVVQFHAMLVQLPPH